MNLTLHSAGLRNPSSGWVSDTLLKRTGSRNLARKLPIITGLFGASTIMCAAALLGAFSYVFLLGDVERIVLE